MEIERMDGTYSSYKTIFRYLGAWSIKCLLMTVVVIGLLIISDWNSSVSAQGGSVHIVRPGENLTVIARRYGVSMNELARHNGIANPNLLRIGQSLRIPTSASSSPSSPPPSSPPPSAPAQPRTSSTATPRYRVEAPNPPPPVYSDPIPTTRVFYTVRPNDTLYGIGRRFGVSVEAIKVRNGLRGDVIWVGQRLIIP